MRRLQPWQAIRALFGHDRGQIIMPDGLKKMFDSDEQWQGALGAWYNEKMRMEVDRFHSYKEADDMDQDDIIVAVLDLYAEDACITGDTKISLVDGREVPVRDLVGKGEFTVYACDIENMRIVPGRAKAIKATKRKVVEVILDNGEKVRCTPDHPFLLRSGEYREAIDLRPGDSLMPLYRKDGLGPMCDYEMLLQPHDNKWHYTHRQFVTRPIPEGCTIAKRERAAERREQAAVVNHKVVSVQECDVEEQTYDVSVYKYKNFALSAGVFTHNTQTDITTGKSLWVESEDEEIEELGNRILETIDAEAQAFPIARELCKYGDSFSGIAQSQRKDGTPGPVVDLIPASPFHMHRIEDADGRLKGFSVKPIESSGNATAQVPKAAEVAKQLGQATTDPPWGFIHWRLLGKNRRSKYGTGLVAPARRPFRRLRMSEDALIIYRLRRSPDRFVFALQGLEGMSVEDRVMVLNRVRKELRKKQLIDPKTGQIRSEMNPFTSDEDFIIDGNAVQVTRLAGSSEVNHVHDIDYLRKRLFGVLKVPADYLGFDDAKSGFTSETPLSYQDVNFARMMKRVQRALMEGFTLLIQLDFCWRGIPPQSPRAKFSLHMNPISAIDEKQRLELEAIRAETLNTLTGIGEIVGIDPEEWQAYIIQRAKLPKHLLRKSGKEADLLKGDVEVVTGSVDNRLDPDKTLTESYTSLSETSMSSITRKVRETLDRDKLQELGALIAKLHRVFNPHRGPNMIVSDRIIRRYDDHYWSESRQLNYTESHDKPRKNGSSNGNDGGTLMERMTEKIEESKNGKAGEHNGEAAADRAVA